MAGSVVVDIKQTLRKMEFPSNVKEALLKVEQFSYNIQSCGPSESIKQTALCMELISEFIFYEKEKCPQLKNKLTGIQELQVLQVIGEYFLYCSSSGPAGDAARNAVFMSLFPHTELTRGPILIKLVSMAIATGNIPLLTATGVLMQQIGSTSKLSVTLTKGLIDEYFALIPKGVAKLQELPTKAPLFAANFLTAIAEIYCNISEPFLELNQSLLEVIVSWINENIPVCFATVSDDFTAALPHGGIPMPSVTPFAGLFKWCIYAPLYGEKDVYHALHYALLNALQDSHKFTSPGKPSIISNQHLATIISDFLKKLNGLSEKERNEKEEGISLSLERIAQFIHLAFYTNSTYGNKSELISKLSSLPENRSLQMVLKRYSD